MFNHEDKRLHSIRAATPKNNAIFFKSAIDLAAGFANFNPLLIWTL
jgi:hypothetical protein